MKKAVKAAVYSLGAIISIVGVGHFADYGGDIAVLKTSVVDSGEAVNVDSVDAVKFDIAIDSVALKEISRPDLDFGYYKYKATLVVRNDGDDLENGSVVISAGENGAASFVRNTEHGFTLGAGQKYIVNNYDVIFPAEYNGGTINFEIDLKDRLDEDLGNNVVEYQLFQEPSKIGEFDLEDVEGDQYLIKLDRFNDTETAWDYKIYTADLVPISDAERKYFEREDTSGVFGYFVIENSADLMSSNWEENVVLDEEFRTNAKFAYAKAIDPEGNYLVSDILYFPSQEKMTKAEFAKYFVEKEDIKINDKGLTFFQDLDRESDEFPYIQTLYNLGLLADDQQYFKSDRTITRGELLPILMDYFDVDLAVDGDGSHFKDVSEKSAVYPYAESLYAAGLSFSDQFNAEKPATKAFLNYLIDAFGKDN